MPLANTGYGFYSCGECSIVVGVCVCSRVNVRVFWRGSYVDDVEYCLSWTCDGCEWILWCASWVADYSSVESVCSGYGCADAAYVEADYLEGDWGCKSGCGFEDWGIV